EEIAKHVNDEPQLIQNMNASYTFNITGNDPGKFSLYFTDGVAKVVTDDEDEVDCTLQMNVDNFKKLLQGKLNATTAFMTGRVKIKGNISLALKLESLLKQYSF